ncbi:hypothetical protein V6N13_099154 [Hibiscus sabdariffa]
MQHENAVQSSPSHDNPAPADPFGPWMLVDRKKWQSKLTSVNQAVRSVASIVPTSNPVFNSSDLVNVPISRQSLEDPRNLLLAPIPPPSPPPAVSVVQQDNLPVDPPGPLPAASKATGKSVAASIKGSNLIRSKKVGILVSKNPISHHASSIVSMQNVRWTEASSKVLRPSSIIKSSTKSLLDRLKHQVVQLVDDSHPPIPIAAIAGANSKDGHVAMVE